VVALDANYEPVTQLRRTYEWTSKSTTGVPVVQLMTDVAAIVRDRLAVAGWELVAMHEPAFSMGGPDDIVYNFSLNFSTRPSEVRMLPALGAQHVPTSRLVSRFKGLPPARTGTIGRSLADIMMDGGYPQPPFARWHAESPSAVPAVAENVCEDLDAFGMPFFRSFHTLDDILVRLLWRPRDPLTDPTLAVASALGGNMDRALEVLRDIADGDCKNNGVTP
jgi:hypothetical protein